MNGGTGGWVDDYYCCMKRMQGWMEGGVYQCTDGSGQMVRWMA